MSYFHKSPPSDNLSEYDENKSTDDLEKELMLAAADADARNVESEEETNEVQQSPPNAITESTTISSSKKTESTSITSRKKKFVGDEPKPSKIAKLNDEKTVPASSEGYANVVATHYNLIEEKGRDERSKSRIVYLRNFHNWIKSMLISEYLKKIKDSKKFNAPIRVLDMGCGKGGDLLKWKKGSINHLICSDIASISVEHCKQRYADMKSRSSRDRNYGNIYTIEYIPADCTRVRLREKYNDPSLKLDLVSCQFAFHYSFESLPQAECMIRNAAECLNPGGFFIGTIPDANDLLARARRADSNSFGNDVYKVVFDADITKPALFGAKYNFYMEGVVDCPEFLVYFPVLIELAKNYGLKFVAKEKFYDFYERMKNEGKQLLTNTGSLESYPPLHDSNLVGSSPDDYKHAKQYIEDIQIANSKIGTLSKSEWEASSLYLAFAFVKVKNTWDADGAPVYDI